MSDLFTRFAGWATRVAGSAYAFITTCILVVVWLISGPFAHFSDAWQLICNTVSTIATTLIVLLIQHSTNRDTRALHLKLDELIRVHGVARNKMIDLEHLSDSDLHALEDEMNTHIRERRVREQSRGKEAG